MLPFLRSSLILPLALFASEAFAKCECGFSVNTQSGARLYTEALETDFLHFSNFIDNAGATGWIRQAYDANARYEGSLGKHATLSNVVPNPLKKPKEWDGESQMGGEAGLNMWVNSTLFEGKASMAEIASVRKDMLYGSYRVAMKPTGTPGTCTGFFWYHNDSQEIDLEFLSRQYNSSSTPVNLVLQSPESVAAGFDASRTTGFNVHQLPFNPSQAFHEYRFDWLPGDVYFMADGQVLQHMTTGVPDVPGWLMLNHWTNGDPNWSGGPPQQDAKNVVSYIKAYFNSSEPDKQKAYSDRCKSFDQKKVCVVPDQTSPPDPGAPRSSSAPKDSPAKTTFFTEQPGAGSGTGKDFAASATMLNAGSMSWMAWAVLSVLVLGAI